MTLPTKINSKGHDCSYTTQNLTSFKTNCSSFLLKFGPPSLDRDQRCLGTLTSCLTSYLPHNPRHSLLCFPLWGKVSILDKKIVEEQNMPAEPPSFIFFAFLFDMDRNKVQFEEYVSRIMISTLIDHHQVTWVLYIVVKSSPFARYLIIFLNRVGRMESFLSKLPCN